MNSSRFSRFCAKVLSGSCLLLALPASGNYKLNDYGFGSGGVGNATSTNYGMQAVSGETGGARGSSSSFSLWPGFIFTQQANVPGAPTFTNDSNYYNKLHLVIDAANNPSDTSYAVAISADNFVTTQYVKLDGTVGSSLDPTDRRTYAAWGGSGGTFIIGLDSDTTYSVKVKAMRGRFTETGYGPVASVATSPPALSFAISTDTQPTPPFTIDFGDLDANTIVDSPHDVNIAFGTNGEQGGRVYALGTNAGLLSAKNGYTIAAVTGSLSSLAEGFGGQGESVSEASGGPLSFSVPYNGSGMSVGLFDTTYRELLASDTPVTGGQAVVGFKAKASNVTPAASDYEEILTFVAAASF
jgi:hypothetical protein